MSMHSTAPPVTASVPTALEERRPSGLDAPAPAFPRLVRVELRKAVDTVTGRWLLIITGALVLGALTLGAFFPPTNGEADLQSLLGVAVRPLSLLLPVLGVLLMSGEFSTRSVLTTFALVPSRGRVVAAKTIAAVILATTGVVLTVLLSLAAGGILELSGRLGGGWALDPVVLLQVLVVQIVYVLVGVGVGLLCQNTPLAIVTYLVVPLLVGTVVVLVPSLREIGPWIELTAGTTPLTGAQAASPRDWAKVATVTALWAGVPFGLGLLRLRRREIA